MSLLGLMGRLPRPSKIKSTDGSQPAEYVPGKDLATFTNFEKLPPELKYMVGFEVWMFAAKNAPRIVDVKTSPRVYYFSIAKLFPQVEIKWEEGETIRIYEGMEMPAVALASRNYTGQIERDIFDPSTDVALIKSPTMLDYSFLHELPSQTACLNRIGFLSLRSLAFEQLALEEPKITGNTLDGFKKILEFLPHFPSLGTVRVMRICRTRKRRVVFRRLDTGVCCGRESPTGDIETSILSSAEDRLHVLFREVTLLRYLYLRGLTKVKLKSKVKVKEKEKARTIPRRND
ncbi:hypothetical protein B0J14DRAFT_698000 [Halenospora varia]|nr:hypothetical protein B0J14DRAFT_698000 [Halenospora varia]